jgi:hypothetical protein
MADIPQEAEDRAAGVLWHGIEGLSPDQARYHARAALEAAAPLLAETIAQKILAHMEEHGPGPASPGVTLHETMRRAWRRHFGIAARVAAGAFHTREDGLRLAAEAIERGDFIGCVIPEVPREVEQDGVNDSAPTAAVREDEER